jgi:hypothetical protein
MILIEKNAYYKGFKGPEGRYFGNKKTSSFLRPSGPAFSLGRLSKNVAPPGLAV